MKKKYDFDRIIDRRGTGALKLDVLEARYGRPDLIPLWVADMDFETPDFITDALKARLEHSVFGYTVEPEDYWPSVIAWIREHHGWNVRREWLSYIPGIVKGIGMVVNVFVKPDEKVIIQPPVYHPFRITPEENGREVVYNPLIQNEDGYYSMDFDSLGKVADEKCRLLILSNPHNPGGLVWDRETLKRLAHFCHSRGIIVVSDEIHCDMALFGHKHIPFASVSEEAASCSITFSAPTKTFNIAGIVSSWCVIPDEALRVKFFKWLKANEFDEPNMFAPIATVAALRNGEEWRRQMIEYIEGNIEFVENWCAEHIPSIKPLRPQASYLVWLDCRGLGLDHDSLIDLFVNKARLALNDGEMFGPGGQGFMRLNAASPRKVLEEALLRLEEAVNGIRA
ncbi:MAG: PatB family C-S lyase [Bacteroidales bacterium]|nr:PatB family C-S lyase [Bacteroidales bacterium]